MSNRQVFTKNMKRSQIWLPSKASTTPKTLYETKSSIVDWVEAYDESSNCTQITDVFRQRISNTAVATGTSCIYRYNGAGSSSWQDYSFRFYDMAQYVNDKNIKVLVRCSGVNGYSFTHNSENVDSEWVADPIWSNVITSVPCKTFYNYSRFEIRGTGAATSIKIYTDTSVNPTTLVFEATVPTTEYDTGTIGLGMDVTSINTARYWYPYLLLVKEIL